MPYSLRRIALGSPNKVGISKLRYEAIAEAAKTLKLAREIEHRFELVLANFNELEVAILDLTFRDMTQQRVRFESYRADRLMLNRKVLNLLSTSRMYLHHVLHLLSDKFGAESSEVHEANKSMRKQYDSVLGHRVMEALRNYVQHRAMPLHTITYSAKRVEEQPRGKFRYLVTMHLDVNQLAADKKFKAQVLHELRTIGAKVELKPFIRDHMASLARVQEELREILRRNVDSSIEIHEKALASWQ